MLHKAQLTRSLKGQAVQCRVCEHHCALQTGAWGKCGVRVNREGTIYLTVYGEAIAAHVDPIEKKPLFHFLPSTQALSVGTYGCNFVCHWCQNWQLSQVRQREPHAPRADDLSPEQIVDICRDRDIPTVAYTYNEPTVFFEYTYDTAKLAHKHGIRNVYVSNGFMTKEMLDALTPYLDGINIDLKGFTESFYEEYIGARLAPVKRNIAYLAQETDVWVEVTTLIIPDLNDSDEELRAIAEWLVATDPQIPWHVTAFYPTHRMQDRPRTPPSTLQRAYDIGKAAGLRYVYVGNVPDPTRENTYCSSCENLLIKRMGYSTRTTWQSPGICSNCGATIPGVWS